MDGSQPQPQRPEDLWALERPDSARAIQEAEAVAQEQARQEAVLDLERAREAEEERVRSEEAAARAAELADRRRSDAQAAARRSLAHEADTRGRPGVEQSLVLRYRRARAAQAARRQESAVSAARAPSCRQRLRDGLRRVVGR